MSPEARRQRERLARAFAWVQRRLGLPYSVTLVPSSSIGLMSVGWSQRAEDDRLAYVVHFNPASIASRSTSLLRFDVFHELTHAVYWPLYQYASDRIPQAARAGLLVEFENCTYQAERAFGPWVMGRKHPE